MPTTRFPQAAAIIGPSVMSTVGGTTALVLLLTFCSLFFSPNTKAATPYWLSQITPLVHRQPSGFLPVKLVYAVSWSKWLHAGSIQLGFFPAAAGQGSLVEATSKARSSGPVQVFWPYSSETRTQISRDTILPTRFKHEQEEHGEKALYEARLHQGRMTVESTITPKGSTGVSHATRTYDLPGIRDVLSALLYLQRAELSSNKETALLVLPLDRLYLVSFRVVGSEHLKVSNKEWKTIRLDVKIRTVTDDFSLGPFSKMHSATIWLSDDAYRVPVEIRADIFVGYISVRLLDRSPP